MATTILDPIEDAYLLFERLHRITVDRYHRMVETGILDPDDRVELLEGVIVEKMTRYPPHILTTNLLNDALADLLPAGYFVSKEDPFSIPERDSQPEPDLLVVRGSRRDYPDRHPTPDDTPLVVEVADSSYATDRKIKWRLYAVGSVPIYWIIDLNRRQLEIHTDPAPEGYRACQILGPDDEAPIVLDGREVARLRIAAILP